MPLTECVGEPDPDMYLYGVYGYDPILDKA